MKTIDFSYFIERYNAGEMSDTEKQWFRKELDGNEKLRQEVNLRKQTDIVIKDQNIMSLRNKLMEIEKGRNANVAVKSSKKRIYLKYAAFVAGLAVIGSIALFSGKNLSSDEIINLYYKTYQAPTSQRSGLSELNTDFFLALEFYNTRDYEKAAALFNKVVENNPNDMQSVLLSGVSSFEERKYPEAKRSFVKVINDNDNLFIETAEWYLALCYVNTDEKEKAIQTLEAIKNDGGIYGKDARKILRKLK
ncbi:MAG: tetratricopeptide repeat protein [Bacteroidetes bacterium]|nr:MAG: tetratricopeptide repeat protein [Bacteroidota bacterium]